MNGWINEKQTDSNTDRQTEIQTDRHEQVLFSGASFVAYEDIRKADGVRPVLEPMSRIAGRMAAYIGPTLLQVCVDEVFVCAGERKRVCMLVYAASVG
jgi:hypothetical protein